MTEALANLAGVLIAGTLLGVEVWVVAIAVLAWMVASPRPMTSQMSIVAALLLGVCAIAYVAAVVLIGVLLEWLV